MIEHELKDELNDLAPLSDRQLIIRAIQRRDERSFAALVERHGPMVLRVCRRILKNDHDAEDVFQAVFFVLARRMRTVRWNSCIANWLYGVTMRIAMEESRRMKRRHDYLLLEEDLLAHLEGDDVSSDRSMELAESERALYQELNGLPRKYRAPLVLCHLQGKTRREAAAELGVKETTVKGRLERAREVLRQKLTKRGLALSTLLLSGEIAKQIAEAAVAESLVMSTTRAATRFAASKTVAGASASAAAGLAKGELANMLVVTQIKWTVLTVSTVAALGIGGFVVSQTTNTGHAAASVAATTAAATTEDESWDRRDANDPSTPDGARSDSAEQRQAEQIDAGAVTQSLMSTALALHQYHSANGTFPAAANYDANQKKLLSWRVHLLPYLGQQQLYARFRLNEPWDSDHNKPLIKKMPEIYSAGSATLQKSGKTMLLVPVGKGTAFESRDPIRIQDITDGTSKTIMIVTVRPAHSVEWTKPQDWEVDKPDAHLKLTGEQRDGFIFCMCDGSARRTADSMSLKTLRALLTRNGSELTEF